MESIRRYRYLFMRIFLLETMGKSAFFSMRSIHPKHPSYESAGNTDDDHDSGLYTQRKIAGGNCADQVEDNHVYQSAQTAFDRAFLFGSYDCDIPGNT